MGVPADMAEDLKACYGDYMSHPKFSQPPLGSLGKTRDVVAQEDDSECEDESD